MVNTLNISGDAGIMEKLKKKYIAFDVETTGLNPAKERIIEVGAVLFQNGRITEDFGSLVRIGIPVPPAASAVNHITDSMLANAPSEDIVYRKLVDFFGDALAGETVICAHNARFDMSFIAPTLSRMGYSGTISYADTLSMSRKYIKGLENYKQDTIAAHFGLVNSCSHRAVSDAEICGKIMWNIVSSQIKG